LLRPARYRVEFQKGRSKQRPYNQTSHHDHGVYRNAN